MHSRRPAHERDPRLPPGVSGPVLRMAATGTVLASATGALTDAESGREADLRGPADRADFRAAHLLARECAATVLGVAAAGLVLRQRCDECGGPHGRPAVADHPDCALSLSHTRGVVAALAGVAGPVGVDVERRGPTLPDQVLEMVLRPSERAVLADDRDAARRQWVRKEALVKVGELTLDTLRDSDLGHLGTDRPPAAGRLGRAGRWYVTDWTDDRLGVVVATASLQPVHRAEAP